MNIALAPDDPIAIVDDNPADRFLAKTCLELSTLTNPWLEFEGGPPLLVHLQQVKAGRESMPGLVLLDISMPKMNGHEVLARVKGDSFFQDLPVFCMLTGSGEIAERERAAQLGAKGFVVKPDTVAAYVSFFDTLAGNQVVATP